MSIYFTRIYILYIIYIPYIYRNYIYIYIEIIYIYIEIIYIEIIYIYRNYIYYICIYIYIRRYVISWCSHAQSHYPLIKHRFQRAQCATSSAVLLWRSEAPFLWPCCGNKQIVGENHGYHTIISYVYIYIIVTIG